MIIIVIGQSGSGKTSFVKERFLKPPYEIESAGIDITKASNGVYGIGRYGIGFRTEGTDTLPYNSQRAIVDTIKALAEAGHDVVAEGDRITNKTVIEALVNSGHPVKIYLVTCSLKTSMKRLRASGSNITLAFVKATKTKSSRIFFQYSQQTAGEVISTEDAQ